MAKLFEEKHEGICVTLKNKQGKSHDLETKVVTLEDYDEIARISKQTAEKFQTKHIFKILFILFGKDKDFFQQFSINLLTDLIIYLKEEIVKKNQAEQNG
jgi:hypothetical protein